MNEQEYVAQDGLGLADLVRRGEVSAEELVDVAIARIERTNPPLNAVVHTLYDEARARARSELPDGAFRGVPFLLKDLKAHLGGTPTTASSRFLVDYVPQHDAELVTRFQRAGVVIVGKTNTPEFGIHGHTEPLLRGPARNPWNPEHTPGGSSGGAGAAVGARMVPLAHGGDGGGSIRIPSACCGLFGLKPTRGRNPMGPDIAQSWGGLVVEHVLTVSVRDSAAMLDATHGLDPGAPYAAPPVERPFLEEVGADPGQLRVGFTTDSLFGKHTDPQCAAAVHDTARLLEELGHDVEEAAPTFDRERLVAAYLSLIAAGTANAVDEAARLVGRTPRAADFEQPTWLLNLIGRRLTAAEYVEAQEAALLSGRVLAPFFDRYDLLLTPTMAHPPIRVGGLDPTAGERALMRLLAAFPSRPLLMKALDQLAESGFERTANTMLFNMSGQPAMSVPLWWTPDGLPIGSQLVGRLGAEATLFRVAAQLEAARPWRDRVPEIARPPA